MKLFIINENTILELIGGMNGVASEVSVFLNPCGRNGFADFTF
jgi:hypothetical protein